MAPAFTKAFEQARVAGVKPHIEFMAHNTLQAVALLHKRLADIDVIALQLDGGIDTERVVRLTGEHGPVIVGLGVDHLAALQAFEIGAAAFLPSPPTYYAAERCLARAVRRLSDRMAATPTPLAPAVERIIQIPDGRRTHAVPVRDILFAKLAGRVGSRHVVVRTRTSAYRLQASLSSLVDQLGDGFIRTHERAVVAESAIEIYRPRYAPQAGTGGRRPSIRVRYVDEWLPVATSLPKPMARRLARFSNVARHATAPDLSEVLYAQAEGKCVRLYTRMGSYLQTRRSISDLIAEQGAGLVRIARGAAVAVAAVTEYVPPGQAPDHLENPGGGAVRIAHTGQWLPVARRAAGHVKKTLTVGSR